MIPYIITWSGSWLTFAPLSELILAASEEGARQTFTVWYPNRKVCCIDKDEQHIYSINGRYSRYFKNNHS